MKSFFPRFAPPCLSFLLLFALVSCSFFVPAWDALRIWSPWARSLSAAAAYSYCYGVAAPSSDTLYAAGAVMGDGSFDFGGGVTVRGAYASGSNAVLARFNGYGEARRANSVTAGPSGSLFQDVAVDPGGNVYAAGYVSGNGDFSFDGAVAASACTMQRTVLVKYDPAGAALWARCATAGTSGSLFTSVAVDGRGNVYAAGRVMGGTPVTFGAGVSAQGTCAAGNNALLVKYAADGTALWARSVTAGTETSNFNGVGLDASGNLYAAGFIFGSGDFTFLPGQTVHGSYASGTNILLVKFNGDGDALWARSMEAGSQVSVFQDVAALSSGGASAAGYVRGGLDFTFGAGVIEQGPYAAGENTVLARYGADGTALWARCPESAAGISYFNGVAQDIYGNVWCAGLVTGTSVFSFFTGVDAQGAFSGENAVLVGYRESGDAFRAQSTVSAAADSRFEGMAADASGNINACGEITGKDVSDFGGGASVAGADDSLNIVLVKYVGE